MSAATKIAPVCLCIAAALLSSACSRSNNLLLGRVETSIATHNIVVTDCYRTGVPPPKQIDPATWQFTPCRDADIQIRNEKLQVNGRSYGRLQPSDAILVDHGAVSIHGAE